MAVAAVGEPSLDSILQARALSREKLRVVCPIEVCNQLALKLTSWKELCPFIGLSELDETEIEEDYRKHRERKIGMLRLWHHKMGNEATFLCLGLAFESLKLRNMIIELLNLYCTHSQRVRQEEQKLHAVPSLDDKPTAHQLIRVVGKSGKEVVIRDVLASQWEELLLELGPSSETYMIKNIDRTCRGDVQEACREVLLKWLSGELPPNSAPVSWRTLIQAIKNLDCLLLATELEQELLP